MFKPHSLSPLLAELFRGHHAELVAAIGEYFNLDADDAEEVAARAWADMATLRHRPRQGLLLRLYDLAGQHAYELMIERLIDACRPRLPDVAARPPVAVEAIDLLARVRRAVGEDAWAAFWLSHVGGLPVAQVAERLDLSWPTVNELILYANERLLYFLRRC
jgi:hypothetical protein